MKNGRKPEELTVLDRLSIVGTSGMGALSYMPEQKLSGEEKLQDLDELSKQCQKILNTKYSEKLDELYLLCGTSGGLIAKEIQQYIKEDLQEYL